MATGEGTVSPRVFLFLQGPSSPLFAEIARKLEVAGGRCIRINLNAGDRISWRRPNAFNYRGDFDGWRAYVRRLIEVEGPTDMILHGEERPYHRVAIEEAQVPPARMKVVLRALDDHGVTVVLEEAAVRAVAATATRKTTTAKTATKTAAKTATKTAATTAAKTAATSAEKKGSMALTMCVKLTAAAPVSCVRACE